MIKILIVGGAGYVGGYLTNLLIYNSLSDEYVVDVYDSLVYEQRYLKDVNFIRGDIRDRELLLSILPKYNIVIWLAALVGDGACAVDPYLTQYINEDSVKWLVDNYNGKIIFMSTCSVYGINRNILDETSPTNPLSVYAKTKLAAEQYIVKNAKNYLIFRLGTLYGVGDNHSRVRLDLVVNILTMKAVLGQGLSVFGGEQWRPLLHVKDVGTACLYAIRNDITGLYNLAKENLRIRDIATKIGNEIIGTTVCFQEMKYEDMRDYKVSCKAFKSLGWKPSHSISEGIKEINKIVKEKRLTDIDAAVYSNEYFLKEKLSCI